MDTKAEAILDAIRKTDVGSDIIICNEDKTIWCILTVKCKEHSEKTDEDGIVLKNNPQVLCPKCRELVDEDTECPFCGNNVGHYRED